MNGIERKQSVTKVRAVLLRTVLSTVRNLFGSLVEQNIAGLIPIVVLLLGVAAILIFLKLSAPIAPFVYTLF